ncbi:MAG: DUF6110 family protein [Lachnospiraceae bacterium]|nr:DUF6110 family protein [Lachnospiraceae bacterium]
MFHFLTEIGWKKFGIFAGGVLFGTAGLKVLSSKDAKKVYTQCTAAVLRAKDCIMEKKDLITENCMDIYEGAKEINTERDREELNKEVAEEAAGAEC